MTRKTPFPEPVRVSTREELINLIFDLMDHNDAVPWPNDSAYTFLQHVADYLHRCRDYYREEGDDLDVDQATWRLFGDALQAAAGFE